MIATFVLVSLSYADTTIPYAPSPIVCKLVYLGPTVKTCSRSFSAYDSDEAFDQAFDEALDEVFDSGAPDPGGGGVGGGVPDPGSGGVGGGAPNPGSGGGCGAGIPHPGGGDDGGGGPELGGGGGGGGIVNTAGIFFISSVMDIL